MSLFKDLNAINVSEKIEKKNNLSYLSWAYAWGEINKHAESVKQTVYENTEGLNYHHDNKTAWVKVGVEADGLEHIEYLPIMNYRNQSIKVQEITSMDVNKAIQRASTKAIARHGIGLYIYAGEDLPEEEVVQNTTNNYPTPSKQTPEDKKRMYAEFVNYVTEYGIDYKEFQDWMADFGVKLGEEIHKWLRNKENLNTQLDSYKTFLSEQSA